MSFLNPQRLSRHVRNFSLESITSSLADSFAGSLAEAVYLFGKAGGRAAENEDAIDKQDKKTKKKEDKPRHRRTASTDTAASHATLEEEEWEPTPNEAEEECRLIIIQITDVYTLENLAHFKKLVEQTRAASTGATVICMLTGDFLSPYLLSTVDHGHGMMKALNRIPLDYIIWGNHEADIDHKIQCQHVRNFKGKWINSNMLDHDAMDAQQEYDVIQLQSIDNSHSRKVGLCAVLSHDPKLYEHFQAPGAFGGATITDPWEALLKYERILKEQEGCDVVVPLQHLYVPDDLKTCEQFDFPVILSGHDHHRVDQVHCGTRLIKPGMNADYASVVEIVWSTKDQEQPTIRSRFVLCKDWDADPMCARENQRAYDVLLPLKRTELASIPKRLEPLSSADARSSVCTMGTFICTLVKNSLNVTRNQQRNIACDAVLLMGGNIRGNKEYPPGGFFSMEALESEIQSDEVVGIVPMPGWLLAEGVQATHIPGKPIPGWMQYDEGVWEEPHPEDPTTFPPTVTHVNGQPLDLNKIYRVATKISDLTNGQSPPWTEYYKAHPTMLPAKGSYVNIQAELLGHFARKLWRQLWHAIKEEVIARRHSLQHDINDPAAYVELLDRTGDGTVNVAELQRALSTMLGLSVDKRCMRFAKFIHSYADITGSGTITEEDIEHFMITLDTDGDQGKINVGAARQESDDIDSDDEDEGLPVDASDNENGGVVVFEADDALIPK